MAIKLLLRKTLIRILDVIELSIVEGKSLIANSSIWSFKNKDDAFNGINNITDDEKNKFFYDKSELNKNIEYIDNIDDKPSRLLIINDAYKKSRAEEDKLKLNPIISFKDFKRYTVKLFSYLTCLRHTYFNYLTNLTKDVIDSFSFNKNNANLINCVDILCDNNVPGFAFNKSQNSNSWSYSYNDYSYSVNNKEINFIRGFNENDIIKENNVSYVEIPYVITVNVDVDDIKKRVNTEAPLIINGLENLTLNVTVKSFINTSNIKVYYLINKQQTLTQKTLPAGQYSRKSYVTIPNSNDIIIDKTLNINDIETKKVSLQFIPSFNGIAKIYIYAIGENFKLNVNLESYDVSYTIFDDTRAYIDKKDNYALLNEDMITASSGNFKNYHEPGRKLVNNYESYTNYTNDFPKLKHEQNSVIFARETNNIFEEFKLQNMTIADRLYCEYNIGFDPNAKVTLTFCDLCKKSPAPHKNYLQVIKYAKYSLPDLIDRFPIYNTTEKNDSLKEEEVEIIKQLKRLFRGWMISSERKEFTNSNYNIFKPGEVVSFNSDAVLNTIFDTITTTLDYECSYKVRYFYTIPHEIFDRFSNRGDHYFGWGKHTGWVTNSHYPYVHDCSTAVLDYNPKDSPYTVKIVQNGNDKFIVIEAYPPGSFIDSFKCTAIIDHKNYDWKAYPEGTTFSEMWPGINTKRTPAFQIFGDNQKVEFYVSVCVWNSNGPGADIVRKLMLVAPHGVYKEHKIDFKLQIASDSCHPVKVGLNPFIYFYPSGHNDKYTFKIHSMDCKFA